MPYYAGRMLSSKIAYYAQNSAGRIYPSLCQAQENLQPVPCAGKRATGAKRGKTCNCYLAQENTRTVPNAGKQPSEEKRTLVWLCFVLL